LLPSKCTSSGTCPDAGSALMDAVGWPLPSLLQEDERDNKITNEKKRLRFINLANLLGISIRYYNIEVIAKPEIDWHVVFWFSLETGKY
jgi:hypothetical protein